MNKTLLTFLLILVSVSAYPQAKAHYFNGNNLFASGDYMDANDEYYLAFKDFDELKDEYKVLLIYNFITSAYNTCLSDTSANSDTLTSRVTWGNSWYYKIDRYNKNETISQEQKKSAKVSIADSYEFLSGRYIGEYIKLHEKNDGLLEKAMFAANQCISVFPEKSIGYIFKGVCHYYLDQPSDAKQNFQKGIAIFENAPGLNHNMSLNSCLAYVYLSRLLNDEGKHNEAKTHLLKADEVLEAEWAALKTKSPHNYIPGKVVYDEKKKMVAEDLVMASALSEKGPEVQTQTSEVVNPAIDQLKRALTLLEQDSTDKSALYTCASYYLQYNKLEKAKTYIDRYLAIDTVTQNGYVMMGIYYMMMAENKRAEIRKLDSENKANYEIAKKKMIVVNNHRKTALTYFEKAHTLEPQSANIIDFILDVCQQLEYYKKYNYYKAIKDKL